ncbi:MULTISPECIES: hypothetical protein [Xanthobacter]|uniref:Uncharacterized protein n=1 Tax=Xanthobacter aminoxidans TaxID=186280 RepID=A0ABW6ZEC5_9HYPH|nr:hypothetical protein [Xanthobacter sp. 91]
MKTFTLAISATLVATALSAGVALADCQTDVASVRGELEEKGKALQAVVNKKEKDPQVLCPAFRAFAAAEQKWVKFLTDNKDWCQIPQQAVDQAAASNKKTVDIRNRVCEAAANGASGVGGPNKPPPQGSMSSALGITTGYSIDAGKNTGVFGTLNGNALK